MLTSLKNMLCKSSPIVGLTTQHVTQPWLAKLYKNSGCDFVFVEYEHGFFNEGHLSDFVLSCRSEGLPVVAKVPECTRTHVAKLLECGVTGIQLPWTETKEQIEKLVSYVKFPPVGIRAVSPGYGNVDYNLQVLVPQFIEEANRETVVIAHVETVRGIENLDEILSNSYVDLVFVGTYDLSTSLGHPGNVGHRDVIRALETVIASAHSHKKAVGMPVADEISAREWFGRGITFFETLGEIDLIEMGARRLVKGFRSLGSREET
jgi:2-dehydro-3-deoxyglucarate aldolase/4-hydroxy-2-oxoheptanedioate aldolase